MNFQPHNNLVVLYRSFRQKQPSRFVLICKISKKKKRNLQNALLDTGQLILFPQYSFVNIIFFYIISYIKLSQRTTMKIALLYVMPMYGQKDIEMDTQFTHEELEQAIKALKMKKNHEVLTKSQRR